VRVIGEKRKKKIKKKIGNYWKKVKGQRKGWGLGFRGLGFRGLGFRGLVFTSES
jgi:hypothetical protein